MSNLPVAAIISCSLLLATPSQSKKSCLNEDILLDRANPSVYIIFERVGERKPRSANESNDGIWLRLHNNTRWAITTYAGSQIPLPENVFIPFRLCKESRLGLREGVEIDANYYFEADEQSNIAPPKILRHDNLASEVWLLSGKSLIFSVPREHLSKYLSVYIPFHYSWEEKSKTKAVRTSLFEVLRDNTQPTHRVHFYYYQLPEKLR